MKYSLPWLQRHTSTARRNPRTSIHTHMLTQRNAIISPSVVAWLGTAIPLPPAAIIKLVTFPLRMCATVGRAGGQGSVPRPCQENLSKLSCLMNNHKVSPNWLLDLQLLHQMTSDGPEPERKVLQLCAHRGKSHKKPTSSCLIKVRYLTHHARRQGQGQGT